MTFSRLVYYGRVFFSSMTVYKVGKCMMPSRAVRCGQKKTITISWFFFSISILIMILTQTDMLYSYKCILCEFEIYFQRKPIRPFSKSCNMSLEQTYGNILYVYVSNQIQQNNMHFYFGHQVLILFWIHLPCFFSILSVCMPGLFWRSI